jgi:hypothetical protein
VPLILSLVLAVAAQVVARGMSRFVIGYPSERGGLYPRAYARLAVVALSTLCLELVILTTVAARSRMAAEVAYQCVLMASGAALARWCRSSEPFPAFLASGILALLWVGLGRPLTWLPLDSSVAWAAWHIAAVRGSSASRNA